MEKLIDKIGVRSEFESHARDWIEYANMKAAHSKGNLVKEDIDNLIDQLSKEKPPDT